MTSPGGQEVGRISVRVVPNTSDFRRTLERDLKAITKGLEFQIPGEADMSRFRAQVERATRNMPNASIDVDADTSGLRDRIERAAGGAKAKVKVDEDDFEGSIDRFQKRMLGQLTKAFSSLEAKIPATVDGETVRRDFNRLEKQITRELVAEVPLKLDEASAAKFRDKINRQVQDVLTVDKITLPPVEFNEYQFSDKQLFQWNKKVDSFIAEQRKKELTFENTQLSDKAMFRMGKQIDKFFEDRVKQQQEIAKKSVKENVAAFSKVNERIAAQVEFGFKLDDFQRDVLRAKRESEKLWADLDASLSIRVEDGEIKRLRKSLSERVVVPVKIQADFDRGGLIRQVAIASAATRQFATAAAAPFRLLTAFPGILAKGFARLGPEVVALTALIAAILPPVIALIAGATTLAPALLAALVPIGAIALGMEGIKRAAEAARPAFDDLRKSVSDVFEFGLPGQQSMTAGFKTLAEQVIPNVKASLQNVAQSLNNQFNAVVGVLASPKGIGNLNNIFDNVAKGLDNAKAGLKGFTSGLLELISAISNKFPGLGTWFSELGEKFAGWVEKFTTIKDGNGLTALERTIQNVRTGIEGLTGVFQAFFSQGLKDIQDPNFGAGMKSFFDTVKSFVTNTLPALSQGFLEVVNLLKQMEPLFNLIGGASNLAQLMVNPGQAISDAVSRFKKGGLKEALTGVGRGDDDPFKELPNQAAKAAAESKQALQDGLQVQGWFGGKGDVAANATSQALDNVKSQVSSQVQAAITEAQTSLQALAPLLQTAIDSAVEPLNQLPTKLGESFALLGASFGGAWDAITNIVTERATGITTAITTAFESIPTKLMNSFAMLGAAVGGAMAGLRGVIASNLGGITDAFGQAFAGVAGRVSSVLSAVPGAVAAALSPTIGVVQQVMLGVINVISVSAQQIIGLASTAFSQFAPVVQAAMAPAITAVSTICQQMVSTALSFAGAMESAGRSIGASFAAGIASSEGLVRGAASALLEAARGFFPNSPAKEGPFSGSGWVDKSGEAVGEAFAAGMNGSTSGVVSAAREMMQAIKDVFGSAEGLTLNFNFGAVTQQFGQMASAAKSFQTSLADTAKLNVPQFGGTADPSLKADLDMQMRQLEMERKSLEIQRAQGMGDQAAIKSRLEEIRLQKLQLGLQQNQLQYAEKYGDAAGGTADHYAELSKKAQDLPTDFAKATGQQFMSDLGMSGQGLIPSLLEQGTQYIFQVANMDTALSAQQTLQRKQALGLVGR